MESDIIGDITMKPEDFPENLKKNVLEYMKMLGIENQIKWPYTKNKVPYWVTLVKKENKLYVINVVTVKEHELVEALERLQDALKKTTKQ